MFTIEQFECRLRAGERRDALESAGQRNVVIVSASVGGPWAVCHDAPETSSRLIVFAGVVVTAIALGLTAFNFVGWWAALP